MELIVSGAGRRQQGQQPQRATPQNLYVNYNEDNNWPCWVLKVHASAEIDVVGGWRKQQQQQRRRRRRQQQQQLGASVVEFRNFVTIRRPSVWLLPFLLRRSLQFVAAASAQRWSGPWAGGHQQPAPPPPLCLWPAAQTYSELPLSLLISPKLIFNSYSDLTNPWIVYEGIRPSKCSHPLPSQQHNGLKSSFPWIY